MVSLTLTLTLTLTLYSRYGRENFQESLKLSNQMEFSAIDWKNFKYMVFDVPNHSGTYAQRYARLEERLAGKGYKHIEIAQKVECKGMQHFEKVLQDFIDKGAEGIILRDPSEPYAPGRAKGYLKHKVFPPSPPR